MTIADMDLEGEERFGRITSHIYNLLALLGGNLLYDFAARDMLEKEENGREITILDVGTGPGILPEKLARMRSRARIYCVDPSQTMVEIARRRLNRYGVKVGLGYSLMVPFKQKFDIICSTMSFHHWAHKKESLEYLSGFLKKDGKIMIYEMKKGKDLPLIGFLQAHRMNRGELGSIASGTGLKIDSIKETRVFIRATYSVKKVKS